MENAMPAVISAVEMEAIHFNGGLDLVLGHSFFLGAVESQDEGIATSSWEFSKGSGELPEFTLA